MQVPYEFKVFCIRFDPDIYEQEKEERLRGEDDFSFAVRKLDAQDRAVVREFVHRLLEAKLTDGELADIWAQGGSRIGFVDERDYRRVFEEIRRRLA